MHLLTAVLVVLSVGTVAASADAPESPKPGKACMVYYTGRVQGVGFRFTAAEIAHDFPVTGWVKNLSDGRVQLLAEGPADAVDGFLKAIRKHWEGSIEKEDVQSPAPTGQYKSFDIAK